MVSEAEQLQQSNTDKFNFVLDKAYNTLPKILKFFISEDDISRAIEYSLNKGSCTIRRNQRNDENNERSELTTVIVKLENISSGISEIKSDMNSVKSDIREDRERLIKVEENVKTLFKRIEELEKK